jgi:DNA-binding LacI/PurR family transcriptional regulator
MFTMNKHTRSQVAKLGVADMRKIAADAEVDVRTLAREIAGKPVRPMMRDRIDRALGRLGYFPKLER